LGNTAINWLELSHNPWMVGLKYEVDSLGIHANLLSVFQGSAMRAWMDDTASTVAPYVAEDVLQELVENTMECATARTTGPSRYATNVQTSGMGQNANIIVAMDA
jgi:hypothetical protein